MAGQRRRILLVEDEQVAREALEASLVKENYPVTAVADEQEALDEFARGNCALIILDLMLPGISGEKLCRAIRRNSDIPILVLSSTADVDDCVASLDMGADDYLAKPFAPRELMARIRALLRRANATVIPHDDVIRFKGLVIDVPAHCATLSGRALRLTTSEFKLLVTLSQRPGQIYTRSELVEKVLGYDCGGYERTIDSHIKNLRAKLRDNPHHPRWLFTVHGLGYRFGPPTKQK
jgi:DNA-binding response OmpR family regulator